MALITDPGTGTDTVTGTDTADTFIWRGGADTYEGGGGGDTLVLEDPLALYWQVNGPNLAGFFADRRTFDISTTSVETFEFRATPFPDRGPLAVEGSEAAERIAVRADEGVPYVVYGQGGDDTLIARGFGNDNTRNQLTPTYDQGLHGGAGDDRFEIRTEGGLVWIYGDGFGEEAGTDRLVVDALRADVIVRIDAPTDMTSQSTATLLWGTRTVAFQSDVEEIEFANTTADGSPLVLRYTDLVNTVEVITGTDAGEVLRDTRADSLIEAGGGNDWITLLGGRDTVDGGTGSDMLSFAEHESTSMRVNLASGSSSVRGSSDSITVTVTNIENVTGTSGNDSFRGDDGANWFRGLGGRDFFQSGAGGDLINGGAGTDSYFADFGDDAAMNMSLLRGRVWDGTGEGTRLSNVEFIFSGGGDDTLTGDHGRNLLYSSHGDDTIMGNGGDDVINGEQGMDMAIYGYARDQYTVTQGTNPFGGDVVFVEYTGPGPGDGLDTLASIEILRFADGDMIL